MNLTEKEERLLRRAEFRAKDRVSRWFVLLVFALLALYMGRLLVTDAILIRHEASARHMSVSRVLSLDWLVDKGLPSHDAGLLIAVIMVHGAGLVLFIALLGIALVASSMHSGPLAQQALLLRMAERLRVLKELPPHTPRANTPRLP